MSFYSRLAATATRLLTSYGRSWTLGGVSGADRNVVAVRIEKDDHRFNPGTFAQSSEPGVSDGDPKFLFEASAAPCVGDRMTAVTDSSQSFVVHGVDPVQPGDTVLAWFVTGRAG
jgi:hypothetical protein